jgi:ribosomal protein S18 acetylase RimI-like enzyme
VQTLVEEARRRGATAVFLEVRADNLGAQSLYKKLGFVEIAVRPKYYQPDGVDALVMTLAITEPKLSPAVGQ